MDTYIPDPEKSIIHYVTVDFTKRFVETPVHLVQYDSSLPILAITLLQSGNSFTIPEGAIALLRYGKTDRTFVILDPLGVSSDRSTVYFEVPYQMTVEYGSHNPIVELWIDSKVAASSSFVIVVDKNPVTNSDIESITDYAALRRFKDIAETSAANAAASETAAQASAAAAAESEYNIRNAEEIVVPAANNARQSELNAAASEAAAKTSETNAKNSEERSQEILDTMEQMVEGGLTYIEANELPAQPINDRTLYGIPSQGENVPSNYRDIYLWKNDGWKFLGGIRGNIIIDTDVTIEPEDWNTETREAIKTVQGVSATNKVYVFDMDNTTEYIYCKSQDMDQLTFGIVYNTIPIPTSTVKFSIQIVNPVLTS